MRGRGDRHDLGGAVSLGAVAPGGRRAVVQRPRDRVHLFRGRDQWLDRASSSLLLSSLELSDTKVYEP